MKKALKYFSIGILVAVLSFFSIGLLHPSFEYENQITVEAPVEVVYEIFTNESLSSEWLIGFQGYEILEGEPLTVGAKFLMKFETDGQPYEFVEIMTAIEDNEEFSFHIDSDMFDMSVQILFAEQDGVTTLTSTTYTSGRNMVYRSFWYIIKGVFQEQSQMNYDLLKGVIEREVLLMD
jgi:uncharacterized protein YndB with AHSA1/START domain|tara:strand:- start:625 stop:1158 length:534 start_codon:yes stop_codon:yes gene_type:complete